MHPIMEGECNCGAVKITIQQLDQPVKVSLCHCLDCRASGGTLYVRVQPELESKEVD